MRDLIDRQALENWLRTECYSTDTDDDKEYVIGRLREELPTIAASPWRMVEEKMPKDYVTVLVYGRLKYSWEEKYQYFVDAGYYDNGWVTFNDWYEGQQEFDILCWMPIEPPKEDA